MRKIDIIKQLLNNRSQLPVKDEGCAFAPSNIALVKYWGKRDHELNLPLTSSLSIALDNKGTETTISIAKGECDEIRLNGQPVESDHPFAKRLSAFLDLFRTAKMFHFHVETKNNIPTGAGLASSASGFAALTLALNDLFGWELSKKSLSIIARMGSGSAARSFWNGFVKWHCGRREDGMDSYAEQLPYHWEALTIGLLMISSNKKPIGSREAMNRTVETSPSYKKWPQQVDQDLKTVEQAIAEKNFKLLGETAEKNAMMMHQTMHDAEPAVDYDLPETKALKQKIWSLRQEGLPLYFTQDAGPNLKLLFLKQDLERIQKEFDLIVA